MYITGNSLASGIAMKYKNHIDESIMIKMLLPSSANSRREGQMWIASMQKVTLIYYILDLCNNTYMHTTAAFKLVIEWVKLLIQVWGMLVAI